MTVSKNLTTRIFRKDKNLKISTVSPNGKFFYRFKEPKDFYWGLFCSPIAFFDKEENLIYYNNKQFAQFGFTQTKLWDIVTWSLSGDIAFFIERNSIKTLSYILLDLEKKKISRTEYKDDDKEKWTTELFKKLPEDKAQEAYYKIISATNNKEVFDYIFTLNLIDDKRDLIKSLELYYYSDFKKILIQFQEGDFDDKIISNSKFDNFKPIISDKLNKTFFEFLGINTWRP